MDCLHSMAPSDEEFLRYVLDSEPLSRSAGEHLKYCSICQRRLSRFKHTEEYLVTRLYRSGCPDAMQLNLYCGGMLSVDKAWHVARHIEYCPLCFNEVKDIQHILTEFEPFPTSSLEAPSSKDLSLE